MPPIAPADTTISVHLLSRPRRPRRAGEWTAAKAVTFIVTLAASRSVTLAARAAGMSRKSAYALKDRDPAFAAAWAAAIKASRQGDKADKADTPATPPAHGDKHAGWPASRRAWPSSASRLAHARVLADYIGFLPKLSPLAPCTPGQ